MGIIRIRIYPLPSVKFLSRTGKCTLWKLQGFALLYGSLLHGSLTFTGRETDLNASLFPDRIKYNRAFGCQFCDLLTFFIRCSCSIRLCIPAFEDRIALHKIILSQFYILVIHNPILNVHRTNTTVCIVADLICIWNSRCI